MWGIEETADDGKKKASSTLGRKVDGVARKANPERRPPSQKGSPQVEVDLSRPMSTLRGMKVANVLRGNVVEGPPVTQERVRGPSPGGFDHIGRGSSDQ